ncbi:cell envelope-related transcriptional attenuator [Thermoanaerobacter mathranii subsp. mathranii str. A3]|uniref:Cell envelope-related transcriptional attenuator n=1 Tax=Thermoanaerobacter mathranii subsp. mathranii (strain DSM 11426 / CCUG 53645 / CIP 108742 / A3) TaxID=583358 RepID=A0ABN3YYJ9_THEM3|nr:LCP family protein [Thermoanaerobacter mathranii]ADH59833.1 cell envelope-related transcriptional attenuator [Thermoanaerobacter mathranii subsp. mathranii str. A3]
MKKTLKIIIFIVIGIILSVGVGTYIFYKNIHGPASHEKDTSAVNKNKSQNNKIENIKRKNILFVGSDENNLSDTILIINYDPLNKKINILSIPRDTYYPRPGFNAPEEKKINAAFSEEKIDGLKNAVENLLNIKIDNYVILNYEGFKKIIDTIGGVEVDVPFNMKYDDNSANPPLHINLKKGRQVLDGEKAIQFIRYRHGYVDGDLGRIKAQHQFLEALLKKILQPSILPKVPSLAITISQYLKTDLSASEITQYAYQFIKDKPSTIDAIALPGEGGYEGNTSYFFVDSIKTQEIVKELFIDEVSNSNISTTSSLENKNIKIEILNGAGIPGLATKYAEILKNEGFNVVKIGNVVGMTFNSSRVYARTDEEKAKKVAKALFITNVEKDISPDVKVDVTVILGKDKK